jgi:hypothetical protein
MREKPKTKKQVALRFYLSITIEQARAGGSNSTKVPLKVYASPVLWGI